MSRILAYCSFFAIISLSTPLVGCRSSSTNVTGPSSSKCAITLTGSTQLTVGGGTSTLGVSTNRECTWTAASQASWIVVSPTSGQGPATLSVTVQANTAVLVRRGAIVVNEARIELEQAAAPCSYSIAPDSAIAPASGGQFSFTVTTSPTCTWTPSSAAPWITVASGGTGSGSFAATVAPNTGAERSGTVTLGDTSVQIAQAAGASACLYSVTASPSAFAAAGGNGTLSIVASQPSCTWTASANVPWVTLSGPASGSGSASLPFSVQANSGGTRAGSLGVAGESASITQAGSSACAYTVTPSSRTVAASGGSEAFDVDTGAACSWTAVSNTPWLAVTGGASGIGAGRVTFSATANSGAARTGTLAIAGTAVSVTQPAGCVFTVAPSAFSFQQAGGTASVTVTTSPGCAWTATSPASWVRIAAGAAGNGSGVVSLVVDPTAGLTARSAMLTIAGEDVRIDQAANTCVYDLSSTSLSVSAAGGANTVAVSASAACPWTATSNDAWLTITSGGSGSGNGNVAFTVSANTGASRIGTLGIAGRTFTVAQAAAEAACTYAIQPTSVSIGTPGTSIPVTLTTQAGCAWTASSSAPWLSVSGAASGTGSATVAINAQANPVASARTGTATIGGQTLTVTQAAAACTYSVAPTTLTPTSAAGTSTVTVTTTAGCTWTAMSNAPSWISFSGSASGTGSGPLSVAFAANPDSQARTGTITVAGQTVTVTQGGTPCSYTVTPSSITAPASPTSAFFVDITTATGCVWAASTGQPWVSITSPSSGTGNGRLTFTIGTNTTGSTRIGQLAITTPTTTVTVSISQQ